MSKEDLCRGQGNLSVHLNPLSLSLCTAISGERTHSVDIRRWQRENDEMRGEQQGNVQLAVWQETNRNLFRNVNLLFYWYNDLLVKRLVCHSFAEVLQPCGEFIILSSVCSLDQEMFWNSGTSGALSKPQKICTVLQWQWLAVCDCELIDNLPNVNIGADE